MVRDPGKVTDARIGDTPAEPAARHVVMLRDGAITTGCLSDPEPICETFVRGVEGLLQRHAVSMSSPGTDTAQA